MTQMSAKIDRLSLLSGDDIFITELLKVKHPTVREIKEEGYNNYSTYIFLLAQNPEDRLVQLDEMGINALDYDNWEIFNMFYMIMPEVCMRALEFFTGFKFDYRIDDTTNESYLTCNLDDGNIVAISEYGFNLIHQVLREMNFLTTESLKFANDGVRKRYIKAQRAKLRNAKPEGLDNLVSAVAWKSPNLSIKEIFDISIYQLYDGYFRLMKIDNYENTMRGLYSGSIDTSKTRIDFNKISWASSLKN